MVALPYGQASKSGIEVQTDTASASTIRSSQGGVSLEAASTVFMQGVKVDAAKDLILKGQDILIQGAIDSRGVSR